MPHIFHIMDLDSVFHMILGRPWIHDYRCVPSTWHQCIKAAPIKGSQIRVRGLQNPFMLEEAHYVEAAFFMEGNILKLARERPSSHSYAAIVDLPSFIQPTANYPPQKLPKCYKAHDAGVVSVPSFTNNQDGSMMPFNVTMHGGKSTSTPSPRVAKDEVEKAKIEKEDLAMATSMINIPDSSAHNQILLLERKDKILELERWESNLNLDYGDYDVDFDISPRSSTDSFDGIFVGATSHDETIPACTSHAPPHFEDGVSLTAEKLVEVNLGSPNDPRPTFLGTGLDVIEQRDILELLRNYRDCFAWSYDEMPGLSPEIALHQLAVKSNARPVKQAKKRDSKHDGAIHDIRGSDISANRF